MIRRIPETRIARLPEHLVNQIAAGEVIERPASVVKELVENSIDAGAVQIRVALEEGGTRLIEVSDNGLGIHADDLLLAVASHATSKLRVSDDLERIVTLGFRGEALASIASVAELELVSRSPASVSGESVLGAGGQIERGPPEMVPFGTRVRVKNLFHNIPARKRFLKQTASELARVNSLLSAIAMAHPSIGFALSHNGRTVFDYPAGQEQGTRVAEVLGEEYFKQMLPLPAGDPRLEGFVGRPELARRDAQAIHLYMNGRAIRDATLLHAVRQAYQGFQIPGKQPVAVLFLTVDPREVDVNVHPAKLEVRFRDSAAIHSLVVRAIRGVLEHARAGAPLLLSPAGPGNLAAALPAALSATRAITPGNPSMFAREGSELGWRALLPAVERIAEHEVRVFQVHDSYLVVEEEKGLVIIDQHALHEKILFEQILASRTQTKLRQPLLLPETVRFDLAEWSAFPDAELLLHELGFEVEEFGERTAIVRAVPAGFEGVPIDELLRHALKRVAALSQGGGARPSEVDLREGVVATMACKRAVKAGQPLSREAMLDLVRGRARASQPGFCPHGRPAELFIAWDELERRFDRK